MALEASQIRRGRNGAQQWAMTADRLIDGSGRPPIEGAALLVKGERIAAVGAKHQVPLAPGLEVFHLPGETILPGFIDTHNHPTLKPVGNELKDYLSQFYDPDARLTARAIRNLRIDLLSGVTTARVVGELSFIDVSLASDVEAGLVVSPHLLPSGPRLGPTGGHVWIPEWAVDGPDNIRHVVRDYTRRGAKLIKLGLLDETPERTSYSEEELAAAVGEAHELGIPVAAHCTGLWGSSIQQSLKVGVDVIEHVVPLNDQIIEAFMRAKAAMSLTPFVYKLPWPQPAEYWDFEERGAASAREWMDYNAALSDAFINAHPEVTTEDRYYGREVFPALRPWMDAVKRAWKAGVPIAIGSDAPHGAFPLNVEFLVDCGLSPLEAITAATGIAAQVSCIADETGTLVPDKRADFISLRGNPLEDIRAVRDVHFIVRNGLRYENLSFV